VPSVERDPALNGNAERGMVVGLVIAASDGEISSLAR